MRHLIGFMTLALLAGPAHAQDSGTMTKRNFNHFGCDISSMTVKYEFRSLMGEPVVAGSYKWEAPRGRDTDCLSYQDKIILKVQGSAGHAYVELDPTVPEAGRGYAYNVSGSPNWGRLFCSFDRSGARKECFSADSAKKFWKAGFQVTDFLLMRES